MKRLFCLLTLFSLLCLGADFSGKWSGTVDVKTPDGTVETQSAFLILTQEGTKVTGTGGPSEDQQHPLRNGTVEGDTMKGEVVTDEGRVFALELKISGDGLTGTVKGETDEGDKFEGTVKMTRVK